jgi:SAM-dependent methyltransferase
MADNSLSAVERASGGKLPVWVNDPGEGVHLHLGAWKTPKAGYINVDRVPFDGIDAVADLEKDWPWEDSSVDSIVALDVAEHLRGWYEFPDPVYLRMVRAATDPLEAVKILAQAIEHPVRRYGAIHFMNEAWRVLRPNGRMLLSVPSTVGVAAFQDPTHVSFWNARSFSYYLIDNETHQPGTWNPDITARFLMSSGWSVVMSDQQWDSAHLRAYKGDGI